MVFELLVIDLWRAGSAELVCDAMDDPKSVMKQLMPSHHHHQRGQLLRAEPSLLSLVASERAQAAARLPTMRNLSSVYTIVAA